MEDVLIKSFTFVLIIFIGYMFKRFKILDKKDANIIATIVMNITLPCALLSNGQGIVISPIVLVLILVGVGSNVVMMLLGYLGSKKENHLTKAAYMINSSGYNIGNFVMPFTTAFFPGMGIAYLISFDMGNSLMCLGVTYALASQVATGKSDFKLSQVIKKLFSSIPFDVYILIFLLSLFDISMPRAVLDVTSTIGAGNSFLAMLMIGLMLEIKIPSKELTSVIKVLGIRIIGFIVLALFIMILPIPTLAKHIVILALAAPLTTVSAVYSTRIGYEADMPAVANSLSIIIAIAMITGLLMMFV
ncbi:MAG: transporter [Thomasclavelia sp.]|jgi:predicted permease|nr:transporter [Thomasclavelia sp.]